MSRRPWMSLYKYEQQYGYQLNYRVPDTRTKPSTCRWCHQPLPTKRNKTFCCKDHADAWQSHFVWNRNRAPIPWRIMCRDKFTCQDCGFISAFTNEFGIEHPSPDGLEVHHIIHVEHGGSDHEDNLVTLCADCHLARHGKQRRQA